MLFVVAAAPGLASEILKPAGVATFDGKTWSGMTIGESVLSDVRKAYQTERRGRGDILSAYTDRSLRFRSEKGSDTVVEAIFSSGAKNALLCGFRVEFKSAAPTIEALGAQLGEKPQRWYAPRRGTDWWHEVFTQHGVVAVMQGDGAATRMAYLLLVLPSRVAGYVKGLSSEPTDQGANPLAAMAASSATDVLEYGSVQVTYNVKGTTIRGQDRDRLEFEQQMRSATAGGAIRYTPGAGGVYRLTITVEAYSETGGIVSADAAIEGNVGGRTMTASGHQSQSYTGAAVGSAMYTYLPGAAMRDAEKDARARVRGEFSPSGLAARALQSEHLRPVNVLAAPIYREHFVYGRLDTRFQGAYLDDARARELTAYLSRFLEADPQVFVHRELLVHEEGAPGTLVVDLTLNNGRDGVKGRCEVWLETTYGGKQVTIRAPAPPGYIEAMASGAPVRASSTKPEQRIVLGCLLLLLAELSSKAS